MGWKWAAFSPSDQLNMEAEIHKDLVTGDLVHISIYLNGFLALDFPLCHNQRMKEVLFTGISRVKVNSPENSRQLANIVYYCGKMKIEWNGLSHKTQKSFFDVIEWCFSGFNEQGISNLIYGYNVSCCDFYFDYFRSCVPISFHRLGAMGMLWRDLPVNVQESLEESLVMNIKDMNEVSSSCFMKGIVEMGYDWNKRERVKEMIFKRFLDHYDGETNIVKDSARGLASFIYNMGELGIKWEEISDRLGESIFHSINRLSNCFNNQDVSNLIYG
jgi:hypothetical protein